MLAAKARVISTQVSLAATTTIDTVNARLNTLITVFALFLLWVGLGVVLFWIQLYRGLGRRA